MLLHELIIVMLLLFHRSSAQLQYGLCSQVYQMHEYCTNQPPNVVAPENQTPHFRRGKSGPRGPPGRTPEIDYVTINATIKKLCESQFEKVNEIEKGQTQMSGLISQLQSDLQNAMRKITVLDLKLTGWFEASNGLFYKVFQTKTDYETAMSRCEEVGAILATAGPRDVDVRREIIAMRGLNTNNIWIGMNDKVKEGTFLWIDGIKANNANTDWNRGQPDNSRGVEDCAHFHEAYNWKMNDASCSSSMKFVCEKNVVV